MTTTQTKPAPKPTALQQLWRDAVTAAVHGQPVYVHGYKRRTAATEVCAANLWLRTEGKRNLPAVKLSVKEALSGVCVRPQKWHRVNLTKQHREAIQQIAMHGGEAFLQGVAVLDCEDFLQDVEQIFGVKLVAEYAVWYREGGVPDRACRVRREEA
jgi:hypothetical protein